ncbi:hypothetical protein [Acinetobacter pollinis]|uniref:Uncharacterized protein n=1 Tax=Acinetobacter pollinis TaxID=2605270 RepID=A0ABU6DUI5_9GAMM|nr:hypothetical protein [Acinetobacter pollinis]MEB5477522.1 hypothetical protein [Acinetobacter pollinis]
MQYLYDFNLLSLNTLKLGLKGLHNGDKLSVFCIQSYVSSIINEKYLSTLVEILIADQISKISDSNRHDKEIIAAVELDILYWIVVLIEILFIVLLILRNFGLMNSKLIKSQLYVFLDILGLFESDYRILEVMVQIGTRFEYEEIKSGNNTYSYYKFLTSGVELYFEDEKLISIFFFTQPSNNYSVFPKLNSFIDNLEANTKREKIMSILGEGDILERNWLKYYLEEKYLHFEFDTCNYLKQMTIGVR